MHRILIVLLAAIPLFASNAGMLTGTVADPTGAAIPAVAVAARNAQTGGVLRTETDVSGTILFPKFPRAATPFRRSTLGSRPIPSKRWNSPPAANVSTS